MKMNFYIEKIISYWKDIYKGPVSSFLVYWNAYGRKHALFKSFYFWASIVIAIIVGYVNLFRLEPWAWQKDVISVIPTIFGFSLGGFAILVGFGNEDFRKRICGKNTKSEISLYMKVNAAFFHFIFVQFICLFYTIFVNSMDLADFWPCYFVGIFLFFYALFTIIAIAFAVLRLARWFDMIYPPNNNFDD